MNRVLQVMFLAILLYSCSREDVKYIPEFQDVNYYTENSTKPDYIIKSELENKHIIALHYPMFVSESYVLIKYISTILTNLGSLSVVHPYINGTESDLIQSITENYPILGFKEFIDLYDFYNSREITFSRSFTGDNDFKLVLLPEDYSNNESNYLKDNYKSSDIININMLGLKEDSNLFEIIKQIPERKKFSSVYSKDKNSIIFFMGEVENYNKVETFFLYNLDNYTTAPEDFYNSQKSLLKNAHVNKMNFYLPELVEDSFTIYGDNKK